MDTQWGAGWLAGKVCTIGVWLLGGGAAFNTVYYNEFNRIKLEHGPIVPTK